MPRVVPLCALLLLAALGCEKNGSAVAADGCPCDLPACQVEIACWCPAPQCERNGCFDGVLYTCHAYGECMDQGPAIDCAAQGLTCWETEPRRGADWSLEGAAFCAPPGCGDRTVQPGEACDDGTENGTRMNACTRACTLPPPAVVDQTNMVGELADPLPLGRRALQTFTAERSGRLAWIVTDLPTIGLFEEREDGFALVGTSTRAWQERDGRVQTEHHFLTPVFVEAGRRYAFDLDCASGCDVTVTRGDLYPAGMLVSESDDATPLLPPDADVRFETWVIEADDGCGSDGAISCPPACLGGPVTATCVGGAWACPAVYGADARCSPAYRDEELTLFDEVRGGAGGDTIRNPAGVHFTVSFQFETAFELARVELPGTEFHGDWPLVQGFWAQSAVLVGQAQGARGSPDAPMVFDYDPPIWVEAGRAYELRVYDATAVTVHEAAPDDAFSVAVYGMDPSNLPDDVVTPVRLWRPSGG